MIGRTTTGALKTTTIDNLGFVKNNNIVPPKNMSIFLKAIEADEPITAWIKVVSVVIRVWISVGKLSRSLVDRRLESGISATSPPTLKQSDFLIRHEKLAYDFIRIPCLNDCPRWNLDETIVTAFSILVATPTRFSVLGLPLRVKMKGSEVPDVYVGQNANVSTLSTVTAIRSAIGHVLLAKKAYTTMTTVTGFQKNFSLVVEHTLKGLKHCEFRPNARTTPTWGQRVKGDTFGSIAVMLGLVGTIDRNADVIGLFLRKLGQFCT